MDGQERKESAAEEKTGVCADLSALKTLQFQIPAYALALDGAAVWAKESIKEAPWVNLQLVVGAIAIGATAMLVSFAWSIWKRYGAVHGEGSKEYTSARRMVVAMGVMLFMVVIVGALLTLQMVGSDGTSREFTLTIKCPVPW